MKNIIKTMKLCKITLRMQPFFLAYGIIHSVISVITLLLPIGIVDIIVGFYQNHTDFYMVVLACTAFALAYYLINCTYFYLGKLYGKNYRSFSAKFETILFNKLKEIDYETYQSSEFLNDYQRALDEGANACVNSFWTVSDVVTRILTAATILSIFAALNPIIIVYALAIGVIFFFLGKFNAKLTWNLSEMQKQNYRERGYIRRVFYLKDSAQDIRTSNVKDLFLDINDAVGDRVLKNTDQYLSIRATVSFLANFLVKSIYPVALAILSFMTLQDLEHNLVNFVALTVAASSLSGYVQGLSDSLAGFVTQAVRGEAVHRVLDRKGTLEVSGNIQASALESITVSHATFSYQDKVVLKDINLTIHKGDKIAIVGENGAGKTTFVKLLLRLYDLKEGSICYNGDNYQEIIPESIRKQIGAVFQDFEVYAFSVGENVLLRKLKTKEDEELVYEALKFSGLYEKVMSFPNGIHTQVTKEFDKEGIEFSGGEKQKLAIARAYAGNYNMIILDEPNSALDPIAEAEIYEKMMKLGENRTLIFISHRLSSTIKADKIYLFDDGRIAESGTHSELMAIENGKYQYMFTIQAKNYIEGSQA